MTTFDDLDPVKLMPVSRLLREEEERIAQLERDARLPPALRRIVAPDVAAAIEEFDEEDAPW